jgi:hypothetical protein
MIQEYYRQMRKFGCNILAVIQQYDIIKESAVRGAMIGNSKMFLKLKSSGHIRRLYLGQVFRLTQETDAPHAQMQMTSDAASDDRF